MSFGGILATALAGGAGAIKDQATGDIEQKRRLDIAAETAKIEEQMRMRLSEFSEKQRRSGLLYDTTGEGGAAKLDLARRSGEQANDLAIKGKVAEATNPELLAAEDAKFDADLKRKIRAGKELLPLEIERAMKLADADAGTRAKYREKSPSMADKLKELEAAIGRPLTEGERLAAVGMGGKGASGEETVKETQYDENGQPIRERTVKGPLGANRPAAEQADPYAVPKREPKPGAKPAEDAKPQGRGILQSLGDAVSGAMQSGAEVGRAIEAVRAKVRAGQPLTAQEQAIAKQYNLTRG